MKCNNHLTNQNIEFNRTVKFYDGLLIELNKVIQLVYLKVIHILLFYQIINIKK